jgi:hypothetical protein
MPDARAINPGLNRTGLTPRDARLIVRYLDAVDDNVTARLTSGFDTDEPHMTFLLCEMLDNNMNALSVLSYTWQSLQEDLKADPHSVRVSLKIETNKYTIPVENRVTSADIGIVVSYRDHIAPETSFSKGALLQAKRLYAKKGAENYDLSDQFREFDFDQLARLTQVQRSFENCIVCYYLFYCPRPAAYQDRSLSEIHRYLACGGDLYDYAMGWHLYEYSSDPERHVPGLLVSRLEWFDDLPIARLNKRLPTARDAFQRHWGSVCPLSWFIVYGMLLGGSGCASDAAVRLVRGQAEVADPPVLPRYVITIEVEVGQPG